MNVITPSLALFSNALGGADTFVILFICLLLFGAKKLPELARSFGQSIKEFKKAASDVEDNFQSAMRDDERNRRNQPPSLPPPPAQAQNTDQASQTPAQTIVREK